MDAYEIGRQGIYIQLGIFDKLKSSQQGREREAAFTKSVTQGGFDPAKDPTGEKMRKAKAKQFAVDQRKKKLQAIQAKRTKAKNMTDFRNQQAAKVPGRSPKPAVTPAAAGKATLGRSVMDWAKRNRNPLMIAGAGLGGAAMLN